MYRQAQHKYEGLWTCLWSCFSKPPTKLDLFSQELDGRRVKLAGHILRAQGSDPLRQVSYQAGSGDPIQIGKRRVGRPRQQWLYRTNEAIHNTQIMMVTLFKKALFYGQRSNVSYESLPSAKASFLCCYGATWCMAKETYYVILY